MREIKFIPNYITEGLKSKAEAVRHILECLIKNHACAGNDGKLMVGYGGQWLCLTPIKKKKNETE